MHSRQRATYALIATTATWGTVPLIVRTVDLPPAAVVAARFWFGALFLTVVLIWERRRNRPSGPVVWSAARGRAVAVALTLTVHWLCLIGAYSYAPVATALFIVFLAPIAIAAFAPAVLGERIDRLTVVALALAVGGFAVMSSNALESSGATGLLLALGGAATFVLLVLLNKPLADTYGGIRAAQMQMTGAAVLIVPFVLAADIPPPERSWLWLVVLGIVHTGIAIAVYLSALRVVGATSTGVLGYLEPATAALWAWLVLSERLSAATLVGGAAIVGAGLLVVRNQRTDLEVAGVTG